MRLPLYQIDAFASAVFSGNPAAVCPLDSWLDGTTLQAIAAENNLSETAFFVKRDDVYELRWFTPVIEVDLCGHATLASAFVILTELDPSASAVAFDTLSGRLTVRRDGDLFVMDFPARPPHPCEVPAALLEALDTEPTEFLCWDDYLVVFDSQEAVRVVAPDMELLHRLPVRGVCVTAPGDDVDFVSRFFAPKAGIPEDPVTGSSHCALAPYWAQRLNKTTLRARQLSKRGGELRCEVAGERVLLAGHAAKYLEGSISLPK
jgi:PhzF family phenazine biosynthesis protein